ncbi:UNVERIFIED_CONTAM: hypothetical protein GTU68_016596 [Idotea baltica]|nr:hypothetical protein [Idotea baltica]
MSVIQKVN